MEFKRLQSILPFFQNLRHEEQRAFVFIENELVDNILFSSTFFKNQGVTRFTLIEQLLPYQDSKYDIIFVHNHPKSFPSPSHGDFDNMKFIMYFCNLSNLILHDYLIVSDYGFFSFKNKNLIPNQSTCCFFQNANNDLTVFSYNEHFNFSSIKSISEQMNNFNYCFLSKKEKFLFNHLSFSDFLDIFYKNDEFFFLYKNQSELTEALFFLIQPFDSKKIS